MSSLEIRFNPSSKLAELTVPPPKPAREYIPEWYKKIGAFDTPKPVISEKGTVNITLKQCMPFIDSLTAGYIQETWQDLYIDFSKDENGQMNFTYSTPTGPEMVNTRPKPNTPIPEDFYPIEFVFHQPWVPEVPNGWSILTVNPLNRLDLPFHVFSGIVESDTFTQADPRPNTPFLIKKSTSGIIPKGTPFCQFIPYKRSDWESAVNNYNEEEQLKFHTLVSQYFWGGYKKLYWKKKTYK